MENAKRVTKDPFYEDGECSYCLRKAKVNTGSFGNLWEPLCFPCQSRSWELLQDRTPLAPSLTPHTTPHTEEGEEKEAITYPPEPIRTKPLTENYSTNADTFAFAYRKWRRSRHAQPAWRFEPKRPLLARLKADPSRQYEVMGLGGDNATAVYLADPSTKKFECIHHYKDLEVEVEFRGGWEDLSAALEAHNQDDWRDAIYIDLHRVRKP